MQNIYSLRVCAYQCMCILFIQETLLQLKKNIMLNVTTIYQDEILRVNTYSLKNKRKGCYMQKKLLMIEHETEK